MTAKQRRFVAEFLTDGNATQAAIRAGYSARTAYQQGHKRLRKGETAAAIEAGVREVLRASIATATERRELLSGIARTATADPHARISAIHVLNKMDGLYVTRVEVTEKADLTRLSDADLAQMEALLQKAAPSTTH